MGLRKHKREIARARLTLLGVGNVNRKFSNVSRDGLRNWEKALYGDSGAAAHKAQLMDGLKRKQKEQAAKSLKKRKIRKVSA